MTTVLWPFLVLMLLNLSLSWLVCRDCLAARVSACYAYGYRLSNRWSDYWRGEVGANLTYIHDISEARPVTLRYGRCEP